LIARWGRIDGPRSPQIHLGSACPQLLSVCTVPGDTAGDVAHQTAQILAVIDAFLSDHGAGREHLLMVQVWLTDIRDFPAFRQVWNRWILPDHPPALSVVLAAAARRDILVEIRAYAAAASG
jgi:enamine deaminase RidA (YjgF/YER057c/UK114 family)